MTTEATNLRPAEEVAALIRTKCLTEAGRDSAKKKLAVTSKDSPYRAEIEQEVAAAESRWEAESPVRDARAALERAGWQWDRETDRCSKAGSPGKPRIKKSLVEAIRAAGLGA